MVAAQLFELHIYTPKNISAVAVANKKCTPCMGFIKQEGILCGNCDMICYFYSTVIVINT